MSNMLRAYRRNILRSELSKHGAKNINKHVKFKDEDKHKSRFARAFHEMIYGKKEKKDGTDVSAFKR